MLLVAQHGDKRGEKGRSHAPMMDCFNADGGGFDADPLRYKKKGSIGLTERGSPTEVLARILSTMGPERVKSDWSGEVGRCLEAG